MTFTDYVAITLLAGVGLILLSLLILAVRNPVLVKLGLRNIPRRPTQSLLIVIGLTLSTIIFVSSLSLGDTLNYSVQRNAIDAYGEVDEIIAPPLLSALVGMGDGDASVDEPVTETEENLNNLLEGGLTSVFTVLEGGLFGIDEERYRQLQEEAAEEPLIDAVAGSIIFPTIIRDINSGQGEPLGFIFAVDDEYDQQFGLTTIDGEAVAIESLEPGVGNIFVQVSSLIGAVEEGVSGLGLEGFSLTDTALLVAGGVAALSTISSAGEFDLAELNIELGTLQSIGIDTTPLETAGIDALNLESLGLDQDALEELGITDTTISLMDLGIDTSGIGASTSNLLGAINLNTIGSDIDRTLGQAGLQLRQGDVYLNRLGAEQLDARVGDVLEVYIGPLPLRFRVRAIVEEAGPMGALLPVVMMDLVEAQKLLFMDGKINNVLVSNLGDEQEGLEHTAAVSDRLRVLAMDPAVVEEVAAILRRPQVKEILDIKAAQVQDEFADDVQGPPPIIADFISNLVGFDELAQQIETLPAELDKTGVSDEFRTLLAKTNIRMWLNDLDIPEEDAADLSRAFRALNQFDLLDPLNKSTIVTAATVGGTVFTTVFTLFGIFSILAAILLIFLIFIMLAAERRSEIGIARAIGVQRLNVAQMFIAEGLVYDLAAASLGIVIGLAISYAMIGFIGGLFNDVVGQLGGQSSIFSFHFRVTPNSVIIAFAGGVIFTFIVLTLASWRASRLNIVAAIRDLPENKASRGGSLFSKTMRWLLGPLLVLAGIALLVNSGGGELGSLRLGATLILVGGGLFVGRILDRTRLSSEQIQRLVYTVIGLGMIGIWALPWAQWLALPDNLFEGDPRLALASFALSGPLVIFGAILVVMFNADVLTWAISRIFGGIGTLTPVLKTAVAYPLNARFRTGTTMLLFAMIISTVTIMSVVIDATQTLVEPDDASTVGFEIATSFSLLSFFDSMEDLEAEIASHPTFPGESIDVVGSVSNLYVIAQRFDDETTEGSDWQSFQLTGLDEGYLDQAEQYYSFANRAAGYDSDAAIWQALRERDDVVVISNDLLNAEDHVRERRGLDDQEFDALFSRIYLEGINLDEMTLPDIKLAVQLSEDSSEPKIVQVIGVYSEKYTLAEGRIQANKRLLDSVNGEFLTPEAYYLKVGAGADVGEVAAELERAFLSNALNASVMAESNAAAQAVTRGILSLFQGFLALGLLVGIAALGVISSRSVVERRQQVGVLRAIGYQRNMVALSFLLESSFIALTGIIIGVIGGVVLGQNIIGVFFNTISPDQSFPIPWLQIGIIVLVTWLFSLLTTLLPAYQASRIYPAEALRYE